MSNPELTWQELLDRFSNNCPKGLLNKIHSCGDVNKKILMCIQSEDVK